MGNRRDFLKSCAAGAGLLAAAPGDILERILEAGRDTAGLSAEEIEAIALEERRQEEREALDVVPVRMGDEERRLERFAVSNEVVAEAPDARAGVEEDRSAGGDRERGARIDDHVAGQHEVALVDLFDGEVLRGPGRPHHDRAARGRRFCPGRQIVVPAQALVQNDHAQQHTQQGIDEVAQAGFGPERIAVTQRVNGCYCVSARAGDSGGSREGVSQRKDAERRDKVSARAGKDTRSGQDP